MTSSFKKQEKLHEEQKKKQPWQKWSLSDWYDVGRSMRVTVTNCAADSDHWIERHAWPAIWAIGSHLGLSLLRMDEGRPADYNRSPVLVLATDRECLVMQLDNMEDPEVKPLGLRSLMMDPSVYFGVFRVDEVRERLKADHELEVANLVDLCELAASKRGDPSLLKTSEAKLVEHVLGFTPTPKTDRLATSNWGSLRLDTGQIKYAAYEAGLRQRVLHRLLWRA